MLLSTMAIGQVLINELDCDSPGVDDMEFLELLTETPHFPLDGYVVVFFNGSERGNNSSYFALDLDGYVTDINGLLLIGSNAVSPVPQMLIPENVIQNGADAVAIYQGNDFDFPEETVATIENLIDVLIYDTSDGDDEDMIEIFRMDPRFASIEQINEGSSNNANSIQRNNDGTYTSKEPTPRRLNDGSGVKLRGIRMAVAEIQYDEGSVFEIEFMTDEIVSEDLMFEISLNNLTFDETDFSGNTFITILENQNSTSTTLSIVDDTIDEGDEVAVIRLKGLPEDFVALNDNVEIRIVDNDFTMAPFGVPTEPTFGLVASTAPEGYYDLLNGKSDGELRQALQDIVANPGVVRAQTYTDVIDILNEADQNPAHSNQVWLVYSEEGRAKLDFQTTSDNRGKWNREHTFPRSRAGYRSIEADDIGDGIDVFWQTSADSLRHGNSDAHALRAADGQENGVRNNQHYGQYVGPVGTLGSFWGDVARSVLYMEIRYNGLEVVNGFPDIDGQLGDLTTLLEWHRNDPPDDFEMNRNNVVYKWQRNRNPFIDEPDLVEYLWGDQVGEVWNESVATNEETTVRIFIYPNPTSGRISLILEGGTFNEASVISSRGKKLLRETHSPELNLKDLAPGLYIVEVITDKGKVLKKVIKE